MTEASVGRQYDRWLRSGSLSGRGYAFLASVPGMLVINTPAYRFDKNLALRPDQRLLDVGCGPGSLLRVVAARLRFRLPPVGIDISSVMLARARKSTPEGSFALVQGTGTSLPLRDNAFDVVTCGYVIKHLDRPGLQLCFRELLRILQPGGLAVIWEFAPTRSRRLDGFNRWLVTRGVDVCHLRSYRELAAAAAQAGFDWVENARLRPFLFPPIPRISVVMGKAPEGWRDRTGPGRARQAALHGPDG